MITEREGEHAVGRKRIEWNDAGGKFKAWKTEHK